VQRNSCVACLWRLRRVLMIDNVQRVLEKLYLRMSVL
jgi:hypothetical protein